MKANPPNHVGILSVIQAAKNAGAIFADTALAEVSLLTGKHYTFEQHVSLGRQHYTIEQQPC